MNVIDDTLFWKINRDWAHPVLDYIMPALSAIEAWMPILILALILLAWRGHREVRWMLVALAIALVMGDAVIGKTLKQAFGRVRPRDAMSAVIVRDLADVKPRVRALFQAPVIKVVKLKKPQTSGNSMPSNHTINLFAAAFVALSFFRRVGVLVVLLACAVAYSRVYVGAHWPSDIPPSIGLGLFCGWLGVVLQSLLRRKFTNTHAS